MSKDIRLTIDEWEAVYACVIREYRRQFSKTLKDAIGRRKALDDPACQRWLDLLKKVEAHIELATTNK